MRTAVITGPRRVELRNEPKPAPREDQLLVDIAACGICTFERRLFSGAKPWYPVAPGHEVAGVVVGVGSGVDGLVGSPQIGDRVALDLMTRCMTCGPCRRGRTALCRYRQGSTLTDGTFSMGGLAEMIAIDAKSTYPVGDASLTHAAMGEPIACCLHSLRRGGFKSGDRVAIIGGGFMGRLHMALTRIGGAAGIGVVDPSAQRRAEATGAGADWVATPEDAFRVGGHQDVVVVAAMGGIRQGLELADAGGTVILYSSFDPELEISIAPHMMHRYEVSVVGVYNQEPEDWTETSSILRSGLLARDLDSLVSDSYPLTRIEDALNRVVSEPTYRVFVEPRSGR